MAITPINPLNALVNQLNPTQNVTPSNNGQKSQFSNFLDSALQQLDNSQKNADKAVMDMATGQAPDLHTAMVALEKANLNITLAVEVRNKVLDAYHEVMRMQI